MKPFLILQLRPEAEAADNEYAAILAKGGIAPDRAHRVRLDCEPLPGGLSLDDYAGVIVGGGPGCVSDPPESKSPVDARIEAAVMSLMPEIIARDLPFMGCCYGIGILGAALGARVSKERFGEPVGPSDCTVTDAGRADPLLRDLPGAFTTLVGHKEALQELPRGCVHLMASDPCPFQMVRYGQNVYATQFHPEADAEVFETRIAIYRHHGYFPPEDADRLVAQVRAAEIVTAPRILANFVARYG